MKKAIIAVLILLAAAAGFWFGRAPYRQWKQNRFLAQARAYLAKSDYRNAVFSARETLAINPANTDACRIIAQIAEGEREPEAIEWRSRIVELQPATSNRLELARTAFLFGNIALADRTLRAVKESERDTPGFHTMVALVASAENSPAAAESHFLRAVQLDPTNLVLQLNLASLRVQFTNAQTAASARESLERLAADPNCRRDALRELAMDRVRHKDYVQAEAWSQKLQAEKPVLFGDELLNLSILKGAGSKDFGPVLAGLEKTASQNPEHLDLLVAWLRAQQMTGEALRWLLGLPAKTPPDRLTSQLIADCYDQRGEWSQVEAMLKDQKWGDLDFIRQAKLAHASRQLQQEQLAQLEWHSAVTDATGRLRPLTALLAMADAWGWGAEKEEVAWLIVQRFPGEDRVLEMLRRLYTSSGNTLGLQKVYALEMKYNPNNPADRNNFAAVSLLLNMEVDQARQIARADYTNAPQDGVMTSTYAFALHLQGKTSDGLHLMEKLKPEELQKPAVAAYYGLLLAASGKPEQAKPWLDLGARASLLPEEKTLLASARTLSAK